MNSNSYDKYMADNVENTGHLKEIGADRLNYVEAVRKHKRMATNGGKKLEANLSYRVIRSQQ